MRILLAIVAFLSPISLAFAAPSIDPELEAALEANPLSAVHAIITYDHMPGGVELTQLSFAGVSGGVVLNNLPMVLTGLTRAQLDAVAAQPGVVSIYGNKTHELYDNASRAFIGQESLQRDREVTFANGGVPVSGAGVGVAVIDTGIDGTHNDVKLGNNLKQNVYFPLADAIAPVGQGGVNFQPGFFPPVFVEDFPMTDVEGGHGTFVAGNVGATGASSGGFYGGVAPGADLIGLVAGNDTGLQTFAIVQAFDWVLTNQQRYNIKVANNSYGSAIGAAENYDPNDPINVGSRAMHDAFIAVVFAAGNDGSDVGAISRLSVAPWVISVAAGEKEGFGSPAGFSSRGIDNGSGVDTAPHPADPNQAPNLRPDITAPGANIISARSKGPGVTNLAGTALGQDLQIPPAFLPFYTTSQGTSFAAPHIAGVVALMIEANPMITPQEIMEILRDTAMPMPFDERIVGAGYVDAHNAVRRAFNMTPVAPPADLLPNDNTPSIVDSRGDQTGLGANDILTGNFSYDPTLNQVVYELTVANLSEQLPNSRWLMESVFAGKAIYVSTVTDELGQAVYEYGEFGELPNGTRQQNDIGLADEGEIDIENNTISIRVGLDKIEAAAGASLLGATSTDVQALSQITIGSSFTGGLLLAADTASGRDFVLGGDSNNGGSDTGGGDGPSFAPCGETGDKIRFAGAVLAGAGHEPIAFTNNCDNLSAKLTYNPGNAGLTLVLEDANGVEVARAAHGNGKHIPTFALAKGDYQLRIEGSPAKSVDYVIQVSQIDE